MALSWPIVKPNPMRTICLLLIPLFLLVPAQAQDAASDLLNRTNGLRASLGLPAYTPNSALRAAAANHAQWMVTTRQVSHVQPGNVRPRDRAANAGYSSTWVSENIYMGTSATAAAAWNFFINSPIHYAGLTSPNYSEIGVATAARDSWRSFVMVFGNPGGSNTVRVSLNPASNAERSASGNAASVAAAGPPPFVVGVDAVGNIMHEIRQGDTLGDIALLYGYTWDDLPYMLELNGMTWDDIRRIQPGNVFLVPPYDGTYTPTAPAPSANMVTEPAPDASSSEVTANVQPSATAQPSATITTAPTQQAQPGNIPVLPTQITEVANSAPSASTTPQSLMLGSILPQQPSVTATPASTNTPADTAAPDTLTITPGLQVRILGAPPASTQVAMVPTTAPPSSNAAIDPLQTPPAWLIVAILVQLSILGFAIVEFVRRSGRR